MRSYVRSVHLVDGIDRILCPLPLKLNTWRGCSGGCVYCSMRLQARLWKSRAGGGGPAPSDPNFLRSKFEGGDPDGFAQQLIRQRVPIQIGMQTDPLQPAERTRGATLEHLKILRDHNYPTIITSALSSHPLTPV